MFNKLPKSEKERCNELQIYLEADINYWSESKSSAADRFLKQAKFEIQKVFFGNTGLNWHYPDTTRKGGNIARSIPLLETKIDSYYIHNQANCTLIIEQIT